MLTWPQPGGAWAEQMATVEAVFFSIALQIARHEPVLLNCATAAQCTRVATTLAAAGAPRNNLFTALVPSDDTWARDHGPVSVLEDGVPRLLDFRFNGWGNKYPAQADNAITTRLAASGHFGGVAVDHLELVLEGGSIDSDGCGTLITTRRCLLHPQRNPGLSEQRLTRELSALLGATRLLWLQHGGLEGDDTDGHIDMLVRFCDPSTLVYQRCEETAYPWYAELKAMEDELHQWRTLEGDRYRLLALPWPRAKYAADGSSRLPASYANFLIINEAVLVPAYDDPADEQAAGILQAAFPDRDIVQIACSALIQQYGSLHCLTMQFPKGVEFRPAVTG
jgi:agmatine/peptidylarginine deiminase